MALALIGCGPGGPDVPRVQDDPCPGTWVELTGGEPVPAVGLDEVLGGTLEPDPELVMDPVDVAIVGPTWSGPWHRWVTDVDAEAWCPVRYDLIRMADAEVTVAGLPLLDPPHVTLPSVDAQPTVSVHGDVLDHPLFATALADWWDRQDRQDATLEYARLDAFFGDHREWHVTTVFGGPEGGLSHGGGGATSRPSDSGAH